jgi:hypothetical protein
MVSGAVSLGTRLSASPDSGDANGEIILGHGNYRYRLDREWSRADPLKTPVQNCHEMVQVSDGRLFLLTDEARNNMLVYDTSGILLDSWTLNLPAAHGLTLHREGSREVFWITDTGGRVVKTDLAGRILQELPHAHACGAYLPTERYAPTEVAVGPDGQLYVADGYGSQFILRFDASGKFIGKFGGFSYLAPKFAQPHGLVVDTREPEPLLLCTERIRNEFQWFTLEGEFVKSVYLPGAFISRPVISGDLLLSAVCFGMKPGDYRLQLNRGFVIILDRANRVVSCPGGTVPTYDEAGQLQLLYQAQPVFRNCHDVCVDTRGDLYVCQWRADGVYPYKLKRVS